MLLVSDVDGLCNPPSDNLGNLDGDFFARWGRVFEMVGFRLLWLVKPAPTRIYNLYRSTKSLAAFRCFSTKLGGESTWAFSIYLLTHRLNSFKERSGKSI